MKWFNKLRAIVKTTDRKPDKNSARKGADETIQSTPTMALPFAAETNALASETSPLSTLTPRERQVFDLLIQGKKLREAAELLGIQYTTVNTHQKSIYKKLDVNSRAECILKYGLK